MGIHTGDDRRLPGAGRPVPGADGGLLSAIVDDPYDFGAIAVANAVSDIYAMGATPVLG